MTTYPDSLSPIGTLTPEERELARTAVAERPLILDDLIMAALGHCERGEQLAAAIIDRVRGGAS